MKLQDASPIAEWQAATVENAGIRPATAERVADLDFHLRLSREKMAIARIPSNDLAAIAKFVRACGNAKAADAIEKGEGSTFDFDQLVGRKIKVQVTDGFATEGAATNIGSRFQFSRVSANASKPPDTALKMAFAIGSVSHASGATRTAAVSG